MSYVRSFPAAASSASVIRQYLRGLLEPFAGRIDEDAAVLLVSELVNNAITHAGDADIQIRVIVDADSLTVAVRDADPTTPVPRQLGGDAAGGRGLAIVERCSQQWGVRPEAGGGKSVWFRMGIGSKGQQG